MAFIRIRSPSKAPPVFRFEGSTEIIAIVLSLKSIKNLRTSSSTNDDLPEPPVPVMPSTGTTFVFTSCSISVLNFTNSSGKFSAAEINRAIDFTFLSFNCFTSPFKLDPVGKSHFSSMSLIIPCKPISRPSSGA